MTLTKDELEQIKGLLKEQTVETERKINTAITNLERTQKAQRLVENAKITSELRTEIQTSEDNIKIVRGLTK